MVGILAYGVGARWFGGGVEALLETVMLIFESVLPWVSRLPLRLQHTKQIPMIVNRITAAPVPTVAHVVGFNQWGIQD